VPGLPAGIATIVVLAVAYSIGVLSATASRLLVDRLSEAGPRALVLSLFSHTAAEDLLGRVSHDDAGFWQELEHEKTKLLRPFRVGRWNALYRWALRTAIQRNDEETEKEIRRRRELCRLVRNLIFPAIFGVEALTTGIPGGVAVAGAGISVLFLYAYAEFGIFVEAVDMRLPTGENRSRASRGNGG